MKMRRYSVMIRTKLVLLTSTKHEEGPLGKNRTLPLFYKYDSKLFSRLKMKLNSRTYEIITFSEKLK